LKFLKCIICNGEIDINSNSEYIMNKKVKCRKCGFSNCKDKKEPEIFFISKKYVEGANSD